MQFIILLTSTEIINSDKTIDRVYHENTNQIKTKTTKADGEITRILEYNEDNKLTLDKKIKKGITTVLDIVYEDIYRKYLNILKMKQK